MAITSSTTVEAGQPRIDEKACTVCGLCARNCPTETLQLRNGALVIDPETDFGCIACGQCMAVCPHQAVTVDGRGMKPDDLIALPAPDQRATTSKLLALMQSRRSVRRFKNREVEPEVVQRMLELASTAPMGIPPSDVRVLVFHGRDKVHTFAADMVEVLRGTQRAMTPLMLTLMRPMLGKAGIEAFKTFIIPLMNTIVREWDKGRDVLLYDAPLAMLFYGSPYSDEADYHIVATYAMLAAQSLGLGTCMIGSVSPFLARNKKAKEKLELPKGSKLGLVLVAGYPAVEYHGALKRHFAAVRYM